MKTTILAALFLVACGGPQFQENETAESDAGSDSNPSVDVQNTPDGAGTTDGLESDAGHARNDAWPDDVILEPYCTDAELYPAYSNTCYLWGASHGWTLTGCCLPTHQCGTVWGNPTRCNP